MKKRAGIAITLIILALLLLTLKNIDFHQAAESLEQINPYYLLAAFILLGISFAAWTLRWKHTLHGFLSPPLGYLYRLVLAGAFVNTITPGKSIGGEPVKAYFLHKKYKKQQTKLLSYIFADETFSLIGTTGFIIAAIILGLIILDIQSQINFLPSSVFVAIPIIAILAIVIWKFSSTEIHILAKELYRIRSIHRHFRDENEFEKYIRDRLNVFARFFKEEMTDKNKVWFGIILSLFYKLFEFLAAYAIFMALGVHVSLLMIIIVISLSNFVGNVTPLPGGIGAIEGSMIILYSAAGLSPETAAIASLLTRLLYYFYTLLLGGLSLLQLKLGENK